ncbi:MAG: phosphotransferase enzyme family protein [Nocardioidaceae bacterium]
MNGSEASAEAARIDAAVQAVLDVAHDAGLRVNHPRLLRDLTTVVVHLAPERVVGRAVSVESATVDRHTLERELAVTSFLAEHGAAVAAPVARIDAGPIERAGYLVTLWEYVEHDHTRPIDGWAAGRRLREIHELLATADLHGLPHFMRAEELTGLLERLRLTGDQSALFERALAAMGTALSSYELDLQPVHGDAHLGNVLRTPNGPVWGDFEKVCLGPRELDIACNEIRAGALGREPSDDEFLGGYGAFDAGLVSVLVHIQTLVLAAWTFALAERRPDFADVAVQRLRAAAEGLGV